MSLSDQVCIVTGGGRGIGRATARRLCGAGASVFVVSRTLRELEETASACQSGPGSCTPIVADVTLPASVQGLVRDVLAKVGRLDALVNNAGVAPLAPIDQMHDADFERLIDVNVRAVFHGCRAAWPALQRAGGTIVNISSLAADDPFPGFAAYGGTKAFVNTFSRALAGEGKPFGIKVFAVAPGAVETEMLRGPFPDFPAEQTLDPDHVAAVVEWCLDPRCTYASGETIRVKK